jgi:hypothetical protein
MNLNQTFLLVNIIRTIELLICEFLLCNMYGIVRKIMKTFLLLNLM